jgi:hypothetical protein
MDLFTWASAQSVQHLISGYTKRRICSADYETVAKVAEDGIKLGANRQATAAIHRQLQGPYAGGDRGQALGVCPACVQEYWRRLS